MKTSCAGAIRGLWDELNQGLFPWIDDNIGELDARHRLFRTVCEAVVRPREFAGRGFTDAWFAEMIVKHHGDIPAETVSYYSAPVEVSSEAIAKPAAASAVSSKPPYLFRENRCNSGRAASTMPPL